MYNDMYPLYSIMQNKNINIFGLIATIFVTSFYVLPLFFLPIFLFLPFVVLIEHLILFHFFSFLRTPLIL